MFTAVPRYRMTGASDDKTAGAYNAVVAPKPAPNPILRAFLRENFVLIEIYPFNYPSTSIQRLLD